MGNARRRMARFGGYEKKERDGFAAPLLIPVYRAILRIPLVYQSKLYRTRA